MQLPKYPSNPHVSGQARLRFKGKDYYLGLYGSAESKQKYARVIAEIASGGKPASAELTIDKLIEGWREEMSRRYAANSREPKSFADPLKILSDLYGPTPASEFTAKSLRAVRHQMIGRGWTRSNLMRQINRIRTMFRWADEEEIVPRGTWSNLRALAPVGQAVPATQERQPVPWEHVEPILPHVPPAVRAMILFQWHTGCRPAEACFMRAEEVQRESADLWVYQPTRHKNQWRGQIRKVVVGAEAIRAIAPWVDAAGESGWVFPSMRRARREHYDGAGYAQAVERGCARAKVPHWTPYQLRHSVKAKVTKEFGLDAARAFLGQKSLEATNGYAAQQDMEIAAKVARKVG